MPVRYAEASLMSLFSQNSHHFLFFSTMFLIFYIKLCKFYATFIIYNLTCQPGTFINELNKFCFVIIVFFIAFSKI